MTSELSAALLRLEPSKSPATKPLFSKPNIKVRQQVLVKINGSRPAPAPVTPSETYEGHTGSLWIADGDDWDTFFGLPTGDVPGSATDIPRTHVLSWENGLVTTSGNVHLNIDTPSW